VGIFEVRFDSLPSPVELSQGLGACSIACRTCGLEMDVLKDEALARAFLAARGFDDS
jgi:hypothetical protein